jgi:hypothetical protein
MNGARRVEKRPCCTIASLTIAPPGPLQRGIETRRDQKIMNARLRMRRTRAPAVRPRARDLDPAADLEARTQAPVADELENLGRQEEDRRPREALVRMRYKR